MRNKLATHEGLMAFKIQQANSWICHRREAADFDDICHQFQIHHELSNPPAGEVTPQMPWEREEEARLKVYQERKAAIQGAE